jgi:xanthosine utilization system XapX-like protein
MLPLIWYFLRLRTLGFGGPIVWLFLVILMKWKSPEPFIIAISGLLGIAIHFR